VHVDGEGDMQWSDIINGTAVEMPANMGGGLRLQNNMLRPMVENMVAYHTAQDFEVICRGTGDREARDRARIDNLWANNLIRSQSLNAVVADSIFFAASYGHCPVHASWRTDTTADHYEPLFEYEQGEAMPQRGFVDLRCGDPWGTIYNDGAKRHSIQWASYEMIFPLEYVKRKFGHIPGIENLEGRKDLPSASRYQRTARRWQNLGGSYHGTSTLFGEWGGEELVALVCREVAPGVLEDFPQGQYRIVALSGAAETDDTWSTGYGGVPFFLHEGPLPARRFSFVNFYAGLRGDDVLGKPYVADLDDLQVRLNQLITMEVEFIRRFARPPLVIQAGSLIDDTITTEDDAILEIMDASSVKPAFLYPPAQGTGIFQDAIERCEQAMFRIGGWQAASRGEGRAGDPAAKVVALQKADDTVFGPVNRLIKKSVVELLQTAHAIEKENQTVPGVIDTVGDDSSYLAEPYIDAERMSDKPPQFEVVSGMGATPDARAKQLVELSQVVVPPGALISADDLKKRFPDPTLFSTARNSNAIREQRVEATIYAIQELAEDLNQEFGDQALELVFLAHEQLMVEFPIRADDLPVLHIDGLSQLTQNESEDPLTRHLATLRQAAYMELLQPSPGAAPPEQGKPERGKPERGKPAGRGARPQSLPSGGEPSTSESMADAPNEVRRLTREAEGAS